MGKKNIDDLQILETHDGYRISVKNFSPDLLLQQSVGLLFLMGVVICGLVYSWPFFMLFLPSMLLAYLAYRTLYNIKDHYLVLIKGNELEIIKGMHNVKIIVLQLSQIQTVYIKRRTGKVLRGAKYAGTTITPDINELRIVTANQDHMVSDEMEYPVQLAIRTKILEQIQNLKQYQRKTTKG